MNTKFAEIKVLQALYDNQHENAKALLRHCIKLEKKQKTFKREDWSDWMDQYGVKA